jgi:hypothetical protein
MRSLNNLATSARLRVPESRARGPGQRTLRGANLGGLRYQMMSLWLRDVTF